MKKYKVTFLIENNLDCFFETVKIKATNEESAQTGAFKTKILNKFGGKGYRFYVVETEVVDERIA